MGTSSRCRATSGKAVRTRPLEYRPRSRASSRRRGLGRRARRAARAGATRDAVLCGSRAVDRLAEPGERRPDGRHDGSRLAVEALRIETPDVDCSGGIASSAHVANLGWCSEMGTGSDAGTTGRALQVEAVRIRLTGALADAYDVYYRAHSEEYG